MRIEESSTISNERHKSALYPRLKNSKRTFKCQAFSFTVLEKPKNGTNGAPGPASASPWRAKRGDPFEIVSIFVAVEVPLEEKFSDKSLAVPKKN